MVSGRTRGTHRGGWRRRSRSARRCPCCPAEENEVKSGGEGGRGANVEVVVVADCGQVVVALAPSWANLTDIEEEAVALW